MTAANRIIHEGRNIKRFREMLGIKQEALADELGDDWSQKKVSLLEQKETIEPDVLEQVAKILKVPADAIKNFSEDAAINVISNTWYNQDNVSLQDQSGLHDNAGSTNNSCTLEFNPIEKLIESMEENKKLYERLLKEREEKIMLLEKRLGEKSV